MVIYIPAHTLDPEIVIHRVHLSMQDLREEVEKTIIDRYQVVVSAGTQRQLLLYSLIMCRATALPTQKGPQL